MAGGLNPLEEALDTLDQEQPQKPAVDPVDAALDRMDAATTFGARRTLIQTDKVGTSPEAAAEARRLSLRYGVPPAEIGRDLEGWKARAQADRPYDAIGTETPAVAEWLQDENNAAIAKDDLEQLGALSWLVTAPGRAWDRGMAQAEFGLLNQQAIFRELSADERQRLEQLRSTMETGGALGAGDSWFRKAVVGAAQQLPITFGAALHGFRYGAPAAVTAGTAAALAGQAGPQIAIPEEVITVPTAFAGGMAAGTIYGGAEYGFMVEAGLALDEYQKFKDETGQPLDPAVAKMAALATGALNGGLEVVGLGVLAKRIPGVNKLTGAVSRGAVREALRNPTVRGALFEAAKGYGETLTAETMVEVAQRAVTILSGELAKVADGSSIPLRTPSDVAYDLKDEAVGALTSFALIAAPGPAMQLRSDVSKARRASQNVAFFQALGEGVQASKTAQRSPEALEQLLERSTVDGPISTLYAPVDTFTAYWQSKGIDPAEMAAELTGDAGAYSAARETGVDLAIPTSRYATRLAGTSHNAFFAQEIRLHPEEMNAREATIFLQEQQAAADAAALEERTLTEREQIRAGLTQQLEAAQVPRRTAEAYAGLVEAGVGTLAEAAGLSPLEVFDRYGLQVERTSEANAGRPTASPTPVETTGPAETNIAAGAPENRPLDLSTAEGEGGAPAGAGVQAPAGAAGEVGKTPEGLEGLEDVPGLADLVAGLSGATLEEADAGTTSENASGESAASVEALSRQSGMRSRGERFVVYDRGGRRRDLIGPEAVDYTPRRGETYGIEGPAGFRVLDDRGGRYTSEREVNERATEAAAGPGAGEFASDAARQFVAVDEERAPEGAGDGGGAERRRLPTFLELGAVEGDQPFERADPEADAARLTPAVRNELERIADELKEFPFVARTWNWLGAGEGKTGNAAGGNAEIVAGAAGAPVYDDVLQWAPLSKGRGGKGSAAAVRGTRAQVEAAIRKALESGTIHNNLAEGAVRVAERREAGDYREISRPQLPPSWGTEAPQELIDDLSAAIDAEVEAGALEDQQERDAIVDDGGDVDDSFDVTTFGQSLFDLFEQATAQPDPEQQQTIPLEAMFRVAGETVDGRAVRAEVPNQASIGASLEDYTVLEGIREIPMSAFQQKAPSFYSASEQQRTEQLAQQIAESRSIAPLIVVVDAKTEAEGPYVLEGGHRFDALQLLGAKSLPALVVVDNESLEAGAEQLAADVLEQPEAVDVLDTGEQQPRLPGAGAVREQEIETPEFEAPFALTAPVDKSRKGKQTTLFQSERRGPLGEANAAGERAYFIGWQQGFEDIPAMALFNIQEPGKSGETTVTVDELNARSIPIPEHPPEPTTYDQKRRGAITFGKDRRFTIQLFEKADLSTFLHETGHFFLEVFSDLVEQLPIENRTPEQQRLARDYAALLEQLGIENRSQLTEAQHEQFARLFEAYLMEGRAPSLELRSIFSKFRAWLLGIYRHVRALNAPMTAEVRGIFDRMLAGEQAIQEAEEAGRFVPLFTTPESAGMTPERFELYRQAMTDAGVRAREDLDRKLAGEVARERSAEWRARRREIRDQVEAELQASPVYQAIAAMRAGTRPDGLPFTEGEQPEPLQLSRAMIAQRFGKDRLRGLPRGIVAREGGLDPDAVATRFGFGSGDELLSAVAGAPPMARAIVAETDRRVMAELGSMLLDGTIHDQAQGAVANEVREGVIRAELRALWDLQRTAAPIAQAARREEQAERDYERRWFEAEAKLRIAIAEGRKQAEIDRLEADVHRLKARARGGAAELRAVSRGIPSQSAINAAAETRIAKTKILDLKPAAFWSASRRAAQQAIERASRQDFAGAVRAKTEELINLAMYRHAERALEDVDRRVRRARDLAKPSTRARLGLAGENYTDQIDGILDRYEFARVSRKVLERRASVTRFVAGLEGEGLPIDLPEEVLNDARRINYQQITVEELIGVTDGLDAIVHLATLKNRLLKAARERDLAKAAGNLADSIRSHARGRARDIARDRRPSEERRRTIGDFFGGHRKLASMLRELDGFEDNGEAWAAVMIPLNDAGARESEMMADATARFAEAVERAFPGKAKRKLYEKLHVPAVGRSLSRMERVMVAANWGNEGNRDRLRSFEGWNDQQVQAILDTLTKQELRFVQDVLDLFESFWPEIEAKQKRVYGVAPAKVEATAIRAAAGEIPGGYFPLKYDDRLSASAIAKLDLEAANLARQAAYTQASTKRGHTKERVARAKLPVRLDFGVMFEHVEQVIHDLTHHEALIDVGRLLGRKEVQDAILETHGDQVYKQIRNTIRDVAFGDVPAVNGFERALNHVRAGATIAGLGWNLTTAMLQPLGLTNSIVRVGPKWIAKGIGRWLRSPAAMVETVGWIEERSAFMRARGRSFNREISEIRNRVGVETGSFSGWVDEALAGVTRDHVTRQGIADSYFWMIQQMQRVADVPTWLGAYEKAMAGGETEERAVHLADQAVLDSQGGGQIKDLAQVQRGGPMMRLWTNFYSFFNVLYNQAVESAKRTNYRHPAEVGRMAADYLMLFVVPATLGYLVREGLRPGGDDDQTPEELAKAIAFENAGYVAGTMLGLREVSGALAGSFGYEGPAGARAFASLARLGQQARQGEADAAFWRALNDVGGVLLHYPAGQMKRTVEGVAALAEGKTKNPGAVLVGAPRD